MRTDPGTAHRHKTSAGRWSDKTDEVSGTTHTHEVTEVEARLAALEARVAVLEGTPPPVEPPPVIIPGQKVVRVSGSVLAIKQALIANDVDVVEVAGGVYPVSSGPETPNSLWIGSQASGKYAIAERTRPVIVREAMAGTVTFDGQGGGGYLSFEDGAHDQTWEGFRFSNVKVSKNGIITFGGYSPRRTPHHLTLRGFRIDRSCVPTETTPGKMHDHAVYFAHAMGDGPHDVLLEDFDMDGRGDLHGGVHVYHPDSGDAAGSMPAHHVTIRRFRTQGFRQPFVAWYEQAPTIREWLVEDWSASGATDSPFRWVSPATTNVRVRRFVSSGSRYPGLNSSGSRSTVGLIVESSVFG